MRLTFFPSATYDTNTTCDVFGTTFTPIGNNGGHWKMRWGLYTRAMRCRRAEGGDGGQEGGPGEDDGEEWLSTARGLRLRQIHGERNADAAADVVLLESSCQRGLQWTLRDGIRV
eukprot:2761571-Pyramimonas_sp.AAC.1